MDGAGDLSAVGAARSAGSKGGVPVKRGWPPSAALTRPPPLPPPRPPFAACSRKEGGSGGRREVDRGTFPRREGGGDGGAAAGRNAVAVAHDLDRDAAKGFPGLSVEREDRGSGGGVGELKSKRRLAPPAARPPPKRRAVSATRRPPPGCGRESAARPVVLSGGEDGLRVGASPSHGGISMSEQATGARLSCTGGSTEEGGLLLDAATANAGLLLEKGGAPFADGFRPKATVVKPSDASGFAGFAVKRGRGSWSDKLGENELVPNFQSPVDRNMGCARARSAHSWGMDTVAPLDSGVGGEMGSQLEIQPAVGGLDASEGVMATYDSGGMACRSAMDVVEATNKDALDGLIECQELEEGEIAATLDIVEATDKNALDVSIEGHKLEEGEIAATMNIVRAVNKDPLDGEVEWQGLEESEIAATMDALGGAVEAEELEEGEIVATMDILKTMSNDALDGVVEGQELEEGDIAATLDILESVNKEALGEVLELEKGEVDATMDIVESKNMQTSDGVMEVRKLEEREIDATIVESADKETLDGVVEVQELVECTNKQALDGAVEVQGLEEDEIAAPMQIVKSTNKQKFDGPVEVQELEESEIGATMDIVEAMNKNMLVGPVKGQELEGEIVAKVHGQEPENSDMAAKGHGEKLVDGETATRYGQEPENGEIAAKGHGQEPVDGETVTRSDHIVQESQFAVDFIPRDSTDSIMRSKMRLTARKPVCPRVKANQTKSDHIVQESQFAVDGIPHDSTDGVMRSKIRLTARKTARAPVTANHMSLTTPDGPKKFKAAQSKHVPVNTASTSALANKEKCTLKFLFVSKEKAKDKNAFYLEGDDILKAVAVHEGKLVLYVNVPSGVGSVWRHRQHVGHNADARSKVRMVSRRFQFLCRSIALAVEQRLLEVPRVDLAADKVIKKFPDHTKHESIVGKVAGVEVGDKFLFRVALAIVGLHRPYRAGIDACKDNNGVLIALSVVASGGYLDELSSSGELIYTGSGGKAAGTAEQDGDQKLQHGNLALKNCITTKTPVRVIHGFKSRNREDGSHSKGKEISIYIYDGLYIVVDCWREGIPGSRVFKYRLRRIPGQPELPLHVTKWIRKSALHPDRRPREREAEPGGGSRSTGDGCRSARDGLRLESR